MRKDDLIRRAQDPKYIPGIYNYCDRWCERCAFTSRCLNYDASEERSASPASRDIHNREFWDQLKGSLETAMEMLRDMAKARGIDLDSIDIQAEEKRERRIREKAEAHPLAGASEAYAQAVDRWFEQNDALVKDTGEALAHDATLAQPGPDPVTEAASLKDCVAVVRWYQFQIHVKLMRALMPFDGGRADPDANSDSHGSAKVALIGMDRSIAAWARMREHLPGADDSCLDLLVSLDRLRRATEKEFPAARAFVRPGFDAPPGQAQAGT